MPVLIRRGFLLFLLSSAAVVPGGSQDSATEFFEGRIRPLLASKCYACHTSSKLGDLRLDSRDAVLKGGKSGPAIIPGQPEDSLLIRAVTHADERLKMPLAGDRLSQKEIADLRKWIETGASWPDTAAPPKARDTKAGFAITPEQRAFWSFQPLTKASPPEVSDTSWAKSQSIALFNRSWKKKAFFQ